MGKLRLCGWNIQFGRRLDLVLEAIAWEPDFSGLDILALQEASEHAGEQDASAIAGRLGGNYLHHQVTAQEVRSELQANALIWNTRRLTEVSRGHLDLPFLSDPSGLSRAEGWLLARLHEQRRGAVVLEAMLDGAEPIRVYCAHADVLGFAHRLRQFAAVLADHAARPQVAMAIIAADLNTFGIASRPSWNALHRAASVAGFKDITSDVRWTHEVRGLPVRQKLDFVFATARPGLSHRAWTLPTRASDHLPQFVELSWP
jgi:endonuclease/exonuclease/phosphatase family metal-dependent hydrolase